MVLYYEIIDGGEHNVYHFLFYMLSNFLIADIRGDIIYYYPNKNNTKVSEGFLSLLPSNFTRHLIKDPNITYISFMNAIPIYTDTCVPESYFLIRELFKPYIHTIQKGKRIYIRREESERKFYNEAEVTACMVLLGFDAINLEEYTIKEQIKRVSEAELIVGAHGAALAFSVFCNKSAHVIEIFGSPLSEKRHFLHIAHVLGHTISRFDTVTLHDGKKENMTVNVPELERFICSTIKI